MAFNPDDVLLRDNGLCRYRFHGCMRHANQVLLDVPPEYIGGTNSFDNARAACDRCAHQQREQRNRAAALLNYIEGF
jgi:5-methylcytosine-specific restriction endonuclease McrA